MELTTHQIYAIAAMAAFIALFGFVTYRAGMASTASALQPQLRTARASVEQLLTERRQLRTELEIERDDAGHLRNQLETSFNLIERHDAQGDALRVQLTEKQADLERTMQDADTRIAALTRRTLTEADGQQLHRIASLLDLARKTFSGVGATDKADQAQTLSRTALNIAAKAPVVLAATAQERTA